MIVHTYHGHVFRQYFSPARTRVFLAIERWLARHTDCLLAVSPAIRTELLALGVGTAAQLRVMPLGLELDAFLACERTSGRLRAELGLGGSVPLVGIVARLVAIKAHEVFLEAAADLARGLPESHFVIVGDGERRSPRCGGRLRVLATVQDPAIVRTILAHGGRARSTETPGPAPPAPAAIG